MLLLADNGDLSGCASTYTNQRHLCSVLKVTNIMYNPFKIAIQKLLGRYDNQMKLFIKVSQH